MRSQSSLTFYNIFNLLTQGMLNSKEERESYYEMMDYFNEGPLKVQLKFVFE